MDPFTGWLIISGLNAAMASQKAAQQAKQRQIEADIRAAEIEASPWTGKAPSTQVATAKPNIWAELAGAGVNTLGQGMALQQAGLFSGSEGAATTATSADPYEQMFKKSQAQSYKWPWENKTLMSTKNPWE